MWFAGINSTNGSGHVAAGRLAIIELDDFAADLLKALVVKPPRVLIVLRCNQRLIAARDVLNRADAHA